MTMARLSMKLSDGVHGARRLQPRRPAAVRCSALILIMASVSRRRQSQVKRDVRRLAGTHLWQMGVDGGLSHILSTEDHDVFIFVEK
jgi:hypothetical protein